MQKQKQIHIFQRQISQSIWSGIGVWAYALAVNSVTSICCNDLIWIKFFNFTGFQSKP